MRARSLLCLVVVAACGDDPPAAQVVGPCDATVTRIPLERGLHVEVGTPITWSSNPPATGRHYPVWAGWDRSYGVLDPGYWVHDEEHGGVVLLHRCGADCPELVDQLVAVARGLPADDRCVAPVRNRVLVVEDPLLPEGIPVAAAAWGAIYTAACYDDSIRAFAADHLGHGPEDSCTDGFAAGGTFITP